MPTLKTRVCVIVTPDIATNIPSETTAVLYASLQSTVRVIFDDVQMRQFLIYYTKSQFNQFIAWHVKYCLF